jgi:FKBP-type peptidyl-prolyl cis-trans isomerase
MKAFIVAIVACMAVPTASFSLSMGTENAPNRRAFFSAAASSAAAIITASSMQTTQSANAAPQIYKTNSGIKYAILKDPKKGVAPQPGDIVAIEYTGYLTDGSIFDGTHSEGKQNALLFVFGSNVVIPGINDMINDMIVGQKVQAILPPELAFGTKGICIEDGECLVKPGATLVYDIYLKKSSIPPP